MGEFLTCVTDDITWSAVGFVVGFIVGRLRSVRREVHEMHERMVGDDDD